MQLIRLLLLLCPLFLTASPMETVPTAHQGRFRPMESFARLWLQELYNHTQIRTSDLEAFNLEDPSALNFLWKLQLDGHTPFDSAPLFWIPKAADKKFMGLEINRNQFSYNELKKSKQITEQVANLLALYENNDYFRALPSRKGKGEWLYISALNKKKNPTAYSDDLFFKLQKAYRAKDLPSLSILLSLGYNTLESKPYKKAMGKSLSYPSTKQLNIEAFYMKTPLVIAVIALYLAALTTLWIAPKISLPLTAAAFLLHTFLLALRIYILERPPVSNMFETVLYVPWVAVLFGLILRSKWSIAAGTLSATALLILLQISKLDSSMENVQAVLDSQYWLTIHVLMVVGSYGLFVMAGILGHIYLIKSMLNNEETVEMRQLAQLLLQTLYVGIALLIPGTILGGVWAAESWGRFWDWDPKESWAFISICIYLIGIHAYTFGYIRRLGLAVGSIIGLIAISFTWYGVNYILGTGLHSYGFGDGGEFWYGLFIIGEVLFLLSLPIANNAKHVLNSAGNE